MRAAALTEAASLPVSSHTFVEASAHALAVTPTAHWIEHLDIAGAILRTPCEVAADGTIAAKGLGLGIEWDERAVAKHAA
jgi:mandelate racemase